MWRLEQWTNEARLGWARQIEQLAVAARWVSASHMAALVWLFPIWVCDRIALLGRHSMGVDNSPLTFSISPLPFFFFFFFFSFRFWLFYLVLEYLIDCCFFFFLKKKKRFSWALASWASRLGWGEGSLS